MCGRPSAVLPSSLRPTLRSRNVRAIKPANGNSSPSPTPLSQPCTCARKLGGQHISASCGRRFGTECCCISKTIFCCTYTPNCDVTFDSLSLRWLLALPVLIGSTTISATELVRSTSTVFPFLLCSQAHMVVIEPHWTAMLRCIP